MGSKEKKLRLSVFGIGKLGCTMLACFAHKGWHVIGMDINREFVDTLNRGRSPIYEPGVDDLIKANRERVTATLDVKEAVMNSDVSFVIVPTPSIEDGSFSTKYVEAVAAEIGSILRGKDTYHLVVITSTVLPGDMHDIVRLLEKTSGKKCQRDFGVCYNPDFIALGTVVYNFMNPDMVLIGESDPAAGEMLEGIHRQLVDNRPSIHRMNFYNAELTKISINSYCTLKITFANTLAEICEKIPGGDVDEVTSALGADVRIGPKYIKGGLSYGGPCFPRDNRAFSHSAARYGIRTPLAETTDALNNYHRNQRIPDFLENIILERKTECISVLGLTYKKDTTLVEESAALYIVRALAKKGIRIKVYDPAGMPEAREALRDYNNIEYTESAMSCIEGTGVCFLATPWDEFRAITKEDFLKAMKTPVIFDAWNFYPFRDEEGFEYREIGKYVI